MLDVRAFKSTDIEALGQVQEMQEVEFRAAPSNIVHALQMGPAWALECGRGVVAIGGLVIVPYVRHKAYAWALVSAGITDAERVQAVRIAARMIRQAKWFGIERIEATTRTGWAPGERVMLALGFKCEARAMEKYGPDGTAHDSWARV